MKTLVIGHGEAYKKEEIRCSPIPVDDWFDESYDSVDAYAEVEPDILFHIQTGVWTFASDGSYDRIVDCTGGCLSHGGYSYSVRHSQPYILREVLRVLKTNGIFYTDSRTQYLYKKQGETLEKIPKQLKKGTKNIFINPPVIYDKNDR
jgi:hypothetical protein